MSTPPTLLLEYGPPLPLQRFCLCPVKYVTEPALRAPGRLVRVSVEITDEAGTTDIVHGFRETQRTGLAC